MQDAVVALVKTGIDAAMVMASAWLPVPAVLVAVTVTLKVPDWVGVPEISPVVGLTLTLAAGFRSPRNDEGRLLAVIWWKRPCRRYR